LYRDKYKTFEEYCRKVWDYSKTHVNRQIGAAHVFDVLTPVGVIVEHESVARPLVGLEDQQIVAAMTEAKKLAGDKAVTAKIVAKAAEVYRSKQPDQAVTKPGKPAVVGQNKSSKQLDFGPTMELLARVEKSAAEVKSDPLMKELAALRKVLQELAKSARKESAS
jgi:hypothetical protein